MVSRWERAEFRKWGDGEFSCWLPRCAIEKHNAMLAIPDYTGGAWYFETYKQSIFNNWAELPKEQHIAEVAELRREIEQEEFLRNQLWEEPAEEVDDGGQALLHEEC